jgi:hypothetical protein
MFKGVLSIFWLVQPLLLLSLTPSLPPLIIQQLSIHVVISSTYTDVTYFDIVDTVILFSFPSSPKFHGAIPLLQTCSTYEFVYYHHITLKRIKLLGCM